MLTSDSSASEVDSSDAQTAAAVRLALPALREAWAAHGNDFTDWLIDTPENEPDEAVTSPTSPDGRSAETPPAAIATSH